MSRASSPGFVWLALWAWTFSLAFGVFFAIAGVLFVEDDSTLLLTIGGILVFVITPLLALWRLLMPRSWKRSLVRRGSRRI